MVIEGVWRTEEVKKGRVGDGEEEEEEEPEKSCFLP